MERTLAETIKEITREHLEKNNGLILGQCLSAVGWVNHTVPNTKNIIELPMTDVAGAGIAAGTAIAGRRPIFVVRFQDFMLLNSSMLVNYAAKAKSIFDIKAPIFIRALATEGYGTGPVHSGILHNLFMYFPGFRVACPITPGEYQEVWDEFMRGDNPMYVSEHRHTFNQKEEIKDITISDADITIYGIGLARLKVLKAIDRLKEEEIKCNFVNLLWLKPLGISEEKLAPLKNSGKGLVVDSGFEISGASQSIAYELMKKTKKYVEALGAEDFSVGTAERYENNTPSVEKIVSRIKKILNEKETNICMEKDQRKKALIITGNLVQDHEFIYPYYRLKEEGFEVTTALKDGKFCQGILGTTIPSDKDAKVISYEEMDFEKFDILVIPGGAKCMEKLRQEQIVLKFIKNWNEKDKIISSICHGAQMLISSINLRGRKISGYYSIKDDINNSGAEYVDAPFVTDKNIISCPHYKYLGDWMKETINIYNNKNDFEDNSF